MATLTDEDDWLGSWRDPYTVSGSIGDASHNVTISAPYGNIGTIAVDDAVGFDAAMANTTLSAGGDITTITVGDGLGSNSTMTGTTIISGGNIGTITLNAAAGFDAAMAGTTIRAGGYIHAITVGDALGYNGVMTGTTINSGGDIGTLTASAGISAAVTAHGSILAIDPGDIAGSFTATTGSLPDITCEDGSITATLWAFGNIGNITAEDGGISGNITSNDGNIGNLMAAQNITGAIVAYDNIGNITVDDGNLDSVTAENGNLGKITVDDGNLAGNITAPHGSIGRIWDNGDIDDAIASGSGTLDILTHGNVLGNISAKNSIVVIAGGNVSGALDTSFGNIGIQAGENVTSGTISAPENVTIAAQGDISSANDTSTLKNVVLVAGGAISSTNTTGKDVFLDAPAITSSRADEKPVLLPAAANPINHLDPGLANWKEDGPPTVKEIIDKEDWPDISKAVPVAPPEFRVVDGAQDGEGRVIQKIKQQHFMAPVVTHYHEETAQTYIKDNRAEIAALQADVVAQTANAAKARGDSAGAAANAAIWDARAQQDMRVVRTAGILAVICHVIGLWPPTAPFTVLGLLCDATAIGYYITVCGDRTKADDYRNQAAIFTIDAERFDAVAAANTLKLNALNPIDRKTTVGNGPDLTHTNWVEVWLDVGEKWSDGSSRGDTSGIP